MLGSTHLGNKATMLDTSPYITPAGVVTSLEDEGAKQALEQVDFAKRPSTPPEIKKYRQSTAHVPGAIVKHFGLADDKPLLDGPYGVKTVSSESVAEVIQTVEKSELKEWAKERREDIYASNKREPLGKSLNRGHKLPEVLETGEAPFGNAVGATELAKHPAAKGLIYPVDSTEPETEDVHRMYIRTHHDYAPGEQRTRGYDWEGSGINLKVNTFGFKEKNPVRNGVAKAINPSLDLDLDARPSVVVKAHEQHRLKEAERLGETKKLGYGERSLPEDHTYGVPSRRFAEWGARRLMNGMYSEEEQLPDVDLGKSVRPGLRNVSVFPDHSFGTPTIRLDIPGPTVKSVADDQNYGDEPDAASLLYPSSAADRGVTDVDFMAQRSREEIKDLMETVGALAGIDDFDAVFDAAAQLDGKSAETCSIVAFRECKASMLF
ncbi:EF-hand domain-containing family member B [Pseudoscourfieldia marina]